MKKFEYKTLSVPTKGWMKYKQDIEALEQMLNELGKQGWEIAVSISNVYEGGHMGNVIVMKRELNH